MPCANSLVLECKSAYIFFHFPVIGDVVIPGADPESRVRFNTLEGQPRGFPPARPTWNGMTQRLCTDFRRSVLAAAGAYLTPIIYSSGQGQATYAEQWNKDSRYRPT